MLQFILTCFLLIHQFVYYAGVEDSFDDPKWAFISLSILFFFILVQWLYRKSYDLKYPGKCQWFIVLGLGIPVLVDFYHDSNFWLHTLGVASMIYCMPYIFRRVDLCLHRPAPLFFALILISTVMEWSGLLPMLQGSQYHLSGFVGNPNLLGACLIFWYWLAKDRVKHKNLLFLLCLGGSILVLSRAAILTLLISEAFQRFKIRQKLLATVLILGSLGLGFYLISNPHKISEFSSLRIRFHEASMSLKILSDHWLTGIGQGHYRNEFFKKLDGSFKGVKDFESEESYKWVRFSSSSHQSILGLFLWLGLPISLFLLVLMLWLIRLIYLHLSAGEQFAIFSVFLMAQVYDLMSFSVILVPCIFVFCKGLSRLLEPVEKRTYRRWAPLLGLGLWAVFWLSVLIHSKQRFEANAAKDFDKLLNSYFTTGEDYHSYARWMLQQSETSFNHQTIEAILRKGHALKADPSTRYHLAMLAMRSKNHEQARKILLEGLQTLPTFAAYYYGLALLAEDRQQEQDYYLLSVKINYYFYQSWKNLGVLFFELGDYERSAHSFKQAMRAYQKKRGFMKTRQDEQYYRQLNEGYTKASELRDLKGKM